MIRIHPADPCPAGDIKISLLIQCAVGIGGGDCQKAVGNGVETIVLQIILYHFPGLHIIDAVGGQDPHIPPAVEIQIIVIVIGKRGHLVDLPILDVLNGIGRYHPVEVPAPVLFDPHDHIAGEPFIPA